MLRQLKVFVHRHFKVAYNWFGSNGRSHDVITSGISWWLENREVKWTISYIITSRPWAKITSSKGAKNSENRRGPSTEPWGIPYTECPTFGQYLVRIFVPIAVSRGRSRRILGGPLKFLRPARPETPFPAFSEKYFCQKRFGKLIVISRLFSRLVQCIYRWFESSQCMGGY